MNIGGSTPYHIIQNIELADVDKPDFKYAVDFLVPDL